MSLNTDLAHIAYNFDNDRRTEECRSRVLDAVKLGAVLVFPDTDGDVANRMRTLERNNQNLATLHADADNRADRWKKQLIDAGLTPNGPDELVQA